MNRHNRILLHVFLLFASAGGLVTSGLGLLDGGAVYCLPVTILCLFGTLAGVDNLVSAIRGEHG